MHKVDLPIFIEVEVSSFCNRSCAWCPNHYNKRGQNHVYMSDNVWRIILNDLQSVNYSGRFAFHNYNEPLADPTILQRVAEARSALVGARLAIYTNGDKLNGDMLRELILRDIDEIRVTLYPKNKEAFLGPSKERILSFLEKLNIEVGDNEIIDRVTRLEVRTTIENTKLRVISPDIGSYTYRGGSVSLDGLSLSVKRTRPCQKPFISAAIDYHGYLKMCCQIYDSLHPDNQIYIIGNIGDEGFLRLWFSDKMGEIRAKVETADFTRLPACQYCSFTVTGDEMAALGEGSRHNENI